jgi:hypothetical protein
MSSGDFVIDQISWHTSVQGNPESRAQIESRFRHLFTFLQANSLLAPGVILPAEGESLADTVCLRASDLTPLGLEVMKKGYDRWLSAVDNGSSPAETKILQKALAIATSRAVRE